MTGPHLLSSFTGLQICGGLLLVGLLVLAPFLLIQLHHLIVLLRRMNEAVRRDDEDD
jgi:hypothetical protein